ncbi:MAG: hypothetical protein HFI38_12390 [Lachnospiraceae bacterium]|nr:hypothetical protein [Lachnospiraceae bacterium]
MDDREYTIWRNNTLCSRVETDKKYLVLKMGDHLISTAGLGWYVLYTLMGIRFGIENGFLPVVDWQNCKLPQYDAKKTGIENVWEYFFEQPSHVCVKDAYASGDFFVIDDVGTFHYRQSLDAEKFTDFYNQEAILWRQYFQQNIRIKKELREHFDHCLGQHVKTEEDIIGILARGTDYKELKPVGHLKPIHEDEIFTWVDSIQDRAPGSKLFLATEDQRILADFEKRYPGKVFSVEAKRYGDLGYDTLNAVYQKENGYERDVKYLYALYAISKAKMCVYSACGGGILASLMREEENEYHFLCHGYNRATGMIVGSSLEKEKEKLLLVGNKPMMFYALNTLKLLHIEQVYIIVTKAVKEEYERIIGHGESYGMRIRYLVSDTYCVASHISDQAEDLTASKTVLLYADYFIHGIGIAKELAEKLCTFDGACVWGTKAFFSEHTESIRLGEDREVPKEAYGDYRAGNDSLLGKYVFDHELRGIVKRLQKEKTMPTLTDILNAYIKRKKLFFIECKRGTIYSKIEDMTTLEKTGQMVCLMEELQKEKIGDFESFRERA